ncbi:hypothetical protein C2845_PM11G18360 [Panicum miliaceum]|uniref:Uncharacterized protein n=1 Tax=Panicum miliaceum TaxID=4540 RepID=A0A3L6RR74_PANMI|nr:hypothetical protein C2845_PM11G18360 [Panicum miliaceum]
MDVPSPSPQRDPSMDPPSRAAQRDQSMSPPPPPLRAKNNTEAWVPPPPPPRAKRPPAKKKEKPQPQKLAYDMSQEELDDHVGKEVREQLALRKPELKQPVDPKGKKFFVQMCQPREKETLSDYDHSIIKPYEKNNNRQYNQVPQFGEQPKQSIPPLKVLSKEDEATAEFVMETNIKKAQPRGEVEVPKHPGLGTKPFKLGEPLMWPELVDMLPTRIRELHQWYLKAATDGVYMFVARVKHVDFYHGLADVWIEFESL